ncbi:uncharacterized protein LOC121376435 [Gigantopelta aegis]|uniref:uncharacterized protein LOC121376435 n=1 Tax=Gigantopelta aegis TaxID=1735272 RepID=UPI001B88902C|nr:uncharacterized protein LOC121376435 [Gigantopelta aegis]
MKVWYLLLVGVALLVRQSEAVQPFCTTNPSVTVSPNDPRLPAFLPPQFQTVIEGSIINSGMTVVAKEYSDSAAGMARMDMTINNQVYTAIVNYNTNQSYHINNNAKCTVMNISTDDDAVLLGNGFGSMKHGFSTQSMLRFAQRYGEQYIGKTTVRGIKVDHWRSCLNWTSFSDIFTLDYYFTDSNWTTLDTSLQIPVRAEIKGEQYAPNGSVYYSFHHIYEYVSFLASIEDPYIFETPPGVGCPNRKSGRSMPKLKPQYQYREEVVDQSGAMLIQTDIWYDYGYKLVRYDYRPVEPGYPFWTQNPLSRIQDYNTGASYVIDHVFGNCTIEPIANSTWDAIHTASSKQALTLRNPEQLFYLDNTFAYAGQRPTRGILCDVYASFKNGTTMEIYFLSKDWTATDNTGIDPTTPDVPVQFSITYSDNTQMLYNLYDFDQEHPNILNAFDITPCYSDEDKISFRISFPYNAGSVLKVYKRAFQATCLELLSKLGQLSPVRIQKTEVHWTFDHIYFLATIVGMAPSIAKFQKWSGLMANYQDDMNYQQIGSATTCADLCDQQTRGTCNSFDYCPKSQVCSLSGLYTSDGKKLSNAPTCSHFSRVLTGPVDHEVASGDAYKVIKDGVYRGGFLIPIKFPGVNEVYRASDITDKIIRNPVAGKPVVKSIHHFTDHINKQVRGFDDLILTGLAVDECAAECQAEVVFDCQSFEFCYDTGNCIMSHIHPDEHPDSIISSQTCDLFVRDYTSKYTQLPGTTTLSKSDSIYQSINNANQCAKLCTDYNGFNCKSFDYCPDIHTCFLGRTHVFDLPKAQINVQPTCNHYSRNYADDFKKITNKVIRLQDNRIVFGLSAEQCAKMCVEEEMFQCSSFDYCGNSSECRLSTAAMSRVGQVTVDSSAFCSIYNRQYYPSGKVYVPPPPPTSAKYTPGAMAGLGIGAIVIGLIIGVIGVLAFSKFTNRPLDEMAVAFTNKYTVSTDE